MVYYIILYHITSYYVILYHIILPSPGLLAGCWAKPFKIFKSPRIKFGRKRNVVSESGLQEVFKALKKEKLLFQEHTSHFFKGLTSGSQPTVEKKVV